VNKSIKKAKGRITLYILLPAVMSVIMLLCGLVFFVKDLSIGEYRKIGIFLAVLAALYGIIIVLYYIINKPYLTRKLISFAMEYAKVQKFLLKDLDIPYCLTDTSGCIMWANKCFAEIIGEKKYNNKSIKTYFEGIEEDDYTIFGEDNENIKEIDAYDRRFRMQFKKVDVRSAFGVDENSDDYDSRDFVVAVYAVDVTEETQLRKEVYDQTMLVGLLYLDNYEEAMLSVEEVRRSLLSALVDRKINKYLAEMDAITKKLERDKYLIIFKQKYLEYLQSDKFSLVDDVKTVNIGNDMSITISVGIGAGGDTYNKNMEYARNAVDLALGRGGDQAVVKAGDKVYYYGGKSKQVEKNTRVKARVKAHALVEVFEEKETVIIMGHQLSDTDALGAAIGVYKVARNQEKKAYIVINEVTSSLRPMLEHVKEIQEYENVFINSEQALEILDKNTVVVVVDVNRPSRTECPELLEKCKSIVVLDHHRQTTEVIENAVLSYIEPFASSACEMIAEVLQYIPDEIKIKQQEANVMYGGMLIDTNNFSSKAGVRTFEAAAFLKKKGADITKVKKILRDNFSDYKARAVAISNAEVFLDHFILSVSPNEGIESPTVVAAQAANELMNISGIKAAFVLTEYQEKIFISARSMDEVNVQIIMERLGGGGHLGGAGAQLEDTTMDEAKKIVRNTVKQMLEEGAI